MLNSLFQLLYQFKSFLITSVLTLLLIFISFHKTKAQFIVFDGLTAKVLVQNVLIGDGVESRNIKYTGHNRSIALFENGDNADLGLDKGIILSTGIATEAKGKNTPSVDNSTELFWPGDTTLERIANKQTKDAAILEFEFKPQTEELEFTYIFSSEEYIRFVDAGFNDVFGFFISGPGIVGEENVAKIPGSNVEVTIDNVNHKRNTEYFIMNEDEESEKFNALQHNAQTVVLKANLTLQPCKWYKIKLAITDVGDMLRDSWVFIGAKSFKHKTAIGSDTSYCSGDFVQTLSAGHPTREVLWSTGERTQDIQVTGPGQYWVEVTTDCGSFVDEVNIYPEIKPLDLGEDTLVCGVGLNKKLEISNRVFDSYKWSTGDTAPSINATEPGEYWIEVTRDGCKARDTIDLKELETPKFSLGADTTICGPLDFVVTPDIDGPEYTWNDGSKSKSLRIISPGSYWLKISNDLCVGVDSINVNNREELNVDIGPPEVTFCSEQDIRLTTQINDTTNYSIEWNTGDRVGAITVSESGNYFVIVRDKVCDFVARDEVNVILLEGDLEYYVPTAFSPNQDNLNETFSVTFGLSNVDEYRLNVYTLWGELVYETTDLNAVWDGKVNGEYVRQGTYVWYSVLKTPCLPDKERYQKGTVTIMR